MTTARPARRSPAPRELDPHRVALAALLERIRDIVTGERQVDAGDLFGRRIVSALDTIERERSLSSDLGTSFRADRDRRVLAGAISTTVEMVLEDVWKQPRPTLEAP